MVSTKKKKQQNKRLFSQVIEIVTDYMIEQSSDDVQSENLHNVTHRGPSSDNLSQVNYPQVDLHTLEENIVSEVRSEVENVITVETRVQDGVLTAIEKLVIPSSKSVS